MTTTTTPRQRVSDDVLLGFHVTPATNGSHLIILVDDEKVIGKMRVIAGSGNFNGTCISMQVEPADDATKAFFADDPNWFAGHLYGLHYSGITGEPIVFQDGDEGRHKDTRIVDAIFFDMGLAHASFANIAGYGDYHKRENRLRIHEPQKRRRPRCSNKIRKVK